MNKINNLGCTLLKLERLKQNKGQKEVCYGICVPSYLSKIENNQVSPDNHILKELFQRLGIIYHCDDAFVTEYTDKINEYFEQLCYSLDRPVYQELLSAGHVLSYSPLAIDWLLIKGFEKDTGSIEFLSQCRNIMTEKQLAYYNLLAPLQLDTADMAIKSYMSAYYVLNNSFSLLALMEAYYIKGQYDKLHEYSDKCVSLALEEGNTCNLAGCYQLIGSAYACLNVADLMLPYYKRAIHLLQNTNWRNQLDSIYYNIGATLIPVKKYDSAIQYLNKVQYDNFLLNQKKALAFIRNQDREHAEEYIRKMEEWLPKMLQAGERVDVERLMLEEVYYECRDNYMEDPGFINLLERLMQCLRRERHRGYYNFYRDIMKDAYIRQRKYKKALELQV